MDVLKEIFEHTLQIRCVLNGEYTAPTNQSGITPDSFAEIAQELGGVVE